MKKAIRAMAIAVTAVSMAFPAVAQSVDKLPASKLPPIEISVFTVNSNFPIPPEDNRAYKLIKDKLGVTF